MNRILLYSLFVVVATYIGGALVVDPPVNLQSTTPGTQQDGNANISGRLMASSIRASNGTNSAIVITGEATNTSGAGYGGLFKSAAQNGRGVRGYASNASGSGIGGDFQSDAPSGTALKAVATASSGPAYALFAKANSPSGFAGYFSGRLSVTADAIIGGALTTSGFTMQNGAAAGRVLRSDGGGTGSWQDDGLALPFIGSTTTASDAINVTNLGSGSALAGNAALGWAVVGRTSDAGTQGVGVSGISDSTSGSGSGVFGLSQAANGFGIFGEAHGSGNTVGVFGQVFSPNGAAVYGRTNANSGNEVAVGGETHGPDSKAISGYNNCPSGNAYGVFGQSDSTGGRAVTGYATATSGTTYGGRFVADSTSARAAVGYATAASGTTYGVYGRADSPSGYAVWAQGRTGASGTKSFRIDHPFDPENKYLLHYSAEGPEPLNVYTGNIVTDAQGQAWVQLPDYFTEINKEFRYTLTVVDDTDSDRFVMAKVAHKIRENRFKIRTSAPNVEVTWRVEGVRNDLWVRKYGAPVVEEKEASEKGTYQHPELYGKPKEKGLGYEPPQTRSLLKPLAARPKTQKMH